MSETTLTRSELETTAAPEVRVHPVSDVAGLAALRAGAARAGALAFSHVAPPQVAPRGGSRALAFVEADACPAPRNPDCVAGKHTACSTTAWDEDADQLTDCACACHEPTGDAVGSW